MNNNNFFFFKQKTAYEMRISDWSSDVCSSDLKERRGEKGLDAFRIDDSGRFTRDRRDGLAEFGAENRNLDARLYPAESLVAGVGDLPVSPLFGKEPALALAVLHRPADRAVIETRGAPIVIGDFRSDEQTSELQSLMRIPYA